MEIVPYDYERLGAALNEAHYQLAERYKPGKDRSITAVNYDCSIEALKEWMYANRETVPTLFVLERWREDMIEKGYSIQTVNARLSAVRKLLYLTAAQVPDFHTKIMLRDWASVKSAKKITVQDMVSEDYGRRLSESEVRDIFNSFTPPTPLALRDRAIFSLQVGAGLRIFEVINLTIDDVFNVANEKGQRGIRVKLGKHHKSRIVVIGPPDHWVFRAVQAFVDLFDDKSPDSFVIRPVKVLHKTRMVILNRPLNKRAAQRAIEKLGLESHDLRRTYAYLSKKNGMSWEALSANLGHTSVKITERYVGRDVSWDERVSTWSL